MNFNFELILFYLTATAGLICLFDFLFLNQKRKARFTRDKSLKLPLLVDYARSFFPVLLIVFLLRSFLYEPFRIPSGSLEPTLLMGDFILVNKYEYGVRLPVLHKKIIENGKPKRGDIIVFRWPANTGYDFIKRVVGLPGDHVEYRNKELYINGEKVKLEYLETVDVIDEIGATWKARKNKEYLLGVDHDIYLDFEKPGYDYSDITVPEGMYFVMGDNRDNSADSRYWGFVPDENIVGKAVRVWMSWNNIDPKHWYDRIRFNRIGQKII